MFGGQLLNALMGVGNPTQLGAPLPQMQGDPMAVPMGGAEADPLVVQGFKPTHRNIIGRLADMWLQAQGQKPIYEPRMQEKDMKRAFEGFSSDPMEVVGRLNQMGRPDLAMKIYDMASDNKRADAAQDRLNRQFDEKMNEVIHDRGINMLGKATPESYPALKQRVEGYWASRGYKPPIALPDQFDADAIEQLRFGEMTVKQQMDYAIRQERLAQTGAATDSLIQRRSDATDIQRDRNAVLEQQGNTRLRQNQERINKTADKGPKYVTTKYGRGILSPDGNAFGQLINGKKHTYVKMFKPDGSYYWKLAQVED